MDMNVTNGSRPYLQNALEKDNLGPVKEMLPAQRIISTAVICVCTFTAVIHVLLLVVLKRCRKMPTALKWLSINFVACNTFYYVSLAVMSILFLTLNTAYNYAIRDLRALLGACTYCVGCGMTAGLALERYFKLTYPYKFDTILSNLNVTIYIVSVWVVSFGVPLGIVLEHFVNTCQSTLWLCDFTSAINKITLFLNSVLLFFTLPILWTVFIIRKQVHIQILKIWKSTQVHPLNIETMSTVDSMSHTMAHTNPNTSLTEQRSGDIARDMLDTTEICIISRDDGLTNRSTKHETTSISLQRCSSMVQNLSDKLSNVASKPEHDHQSQDDTQERNGVAYKPQQIHSKQLFEKRNFRATQNTLKIIITYTFFHVLMIIPGIFITSYPGWRTTTTRTLVQSFWFVCTLAGSYIALYLYIWKFRECKMLFLITFCSWNQRLFYKGNQLKIDVYNIVTRTDIRKRESSL